MAGTNCLVQVVCNATLQTFGGDVYIGIMTVTNSVREIFNLPDVEGSGTSMFELYVDGSFYSSQSVEF